MHIELYVRDKMKKVLLGTSAIALAGAFASPAAAAEWEVRVGGYMTQFVAYAGSDSDATGDYDGIDSKSDAEVWFMPSITLDNGIRIGANIQLEAAGYIGTSDTIDEQYMFVRGSFGEINLGSENSAGYKMSYSAPDVSLVGLNSGSTTAFIPWAANGGASDVFRGTMGSTFIENERNNDANRFTYYTPRFAGFQVGASYARDANQDTTSQVDTDAENIHNIFDLGANYVNSFGDFNVAISGRWGTASQDGSNPTVWGAGINLGYAGFTLGGSFAKQNKAELQDGHAFDVGVSYETGPWAFSVTWFHGENEGNGDGNPDFTLDSDTGAIVMPTFTAESGDEEVDQFAVGINYSLAKGVTVGAFGAYVNFDDAHDGNSVNDVDGFIIGTGIAINF